VNQRVVRGVEAASRAVLFAVAGTQFEDDAAAADGGKVVAHRATRAVECRSKAFLGGFDLGEVLEAETELAELERCQARQRDARRERLRLCARVQEQSRAPRRQRPSEEGLHCEPPFAGSTTSVARMK
jgi:hypothetical protein